MTFPTPPTPRSSSLPAIKDVHECLLKPEDEPKELIKGLFHESTKGVIGGATKTNKTWVLIDIALSISHGVPWMEMETTQGKVLYINFEIPKFFFTKRVAAVAKAKGVEIKPGMLDVWNLRGHAGAYTKLIPSLLDHIERGRYVLVLLDPIYKILGEADENRASDITRLLNELESITTATGAAVFFSAHFPKGNMAEREHIDRISGSGVFARDPDSILTITSHKKDRCYTMDCTLRNFPPTDSFVIRWRYPIMERARDLDPKDIKAPRRGRPETHDATDLLALLPQAGLSFTLWCEEAKVKLGISRATFARKVKVLEQEELIEQDLDSDVWRTVSLGDVGGNGKL